MTGIVREVKIGDCRLIQGDCLEVMPGLGAVDCALTDPPYGTTACKWDSVIPFEPMWAQLKRIVKPNGAIVLTASQPFTSALVMSNVKMFKYCWVFGKSLPVGHGYAKYRPMSNHEDCVVFSNGGGKTFYNPQLTERDQPRSYKRKSASLSGSSSMISHDGDTRLLLGKQPTTIQFFNTSVQKGKVHPTQKPVALMEYLIRTYTNPGETVLDFTMGSGTTGCAAANMGRKFIGIERDPGYFDVAVKRAREAVELASAPVQGGMGF
jgi:site-specific DNA-methyltransferase (adenine-specific)